MGKAGGRGAGVDGDRADARARQDRPLKIEELLEPQNELVLVRRLPPQKLSEVLELPQRVAVTSEVAEVLKRGPEAPGFLTPGRLIIISPMCGTPVALEGIRSDEEALFITPSEVKCLVRQE